MQHNFIAIDGNTGAGKSSLAKLLHEHNGGELILEGFIENPFLPLTYQNPGQFALQNEMYFILERFLQQHEIVDYHTLNDSLHISDYLFEKSLLYAKVNLSAVEFHLFEQIYHHLFPMEVHPDLVVYLYVSVNRLKRNIQKRGRDFEQQVRSQYLIDVEHNYQEYLASKKDWRIVMIEVDELDFVGVEADKEWILNYLQQDFPMGITRIKK